MDKPKTKTRLQVLPAEVRQRRLSAFLTIDELAAKSGVGRSTIYALEGGSYLGISMANVRKLAVAFGCDPSEITEIVEEEVSA